MSSNRVSRVQMLLVMILLVVLQFYVRPRLWDTRISPDFLLIALMLFAMRSSPGLAALAGFAVGLIADTLTPARFGAACAGAHPGRVSGIVGPRRVLRRQHAGQRWVRGRRPLAARLHRADGERNGDHRQMLIELTLYSPLQALTTRWLALIVLVAFRSMFSVRLDV